MSPVEPTDPDGSTEPRSTDDLDESSPSRDAADEMVADPHIDASDAHVPHVDTPDDPASLDLDAIERDLDDVERSLDRLADGTYFTDAPADEQPTHAE